MRKSTKSNWWLVVIKGLLSILFGLSILVWPNTTLEVLIALIGLYLLLDGIVDSLASLLSIKEDNNWWIKTFQGVLSLLSGIAILNYPKESVAIVFFLFSLWLILMGILSVVTALVMKHESGFEWHMILIGVISIILGVLFINNPYNSLEIMVVLSGVYAIISGILNTALGFKLKPEKSSS